MEDPQWDAAYGALREFARAHGRVPARDEAADAPPQLGTWAAAQRQARRRGELSAERAARLESVPGWHWETNTAWRAAYDALCEFTRAHERLPKQSEAVGGLRLGAWVHYQRSAHGSGRLAAERATLLEAVPGWFWKSNTDAAWRAAYDALCEFARARGRIPRQCETVGDLRLGAWVCYQRQARRRGELDAEKAALLEAVPGWFWKFDADAAWRATYDALCEFVRARGRLPKQAESAGDLRLGVWVHHQRSARSTGRLAAERAALLEAVPGWRWAQDIDEAWRDAYDSLREYVRANERYPMQHETVGVRQLNKWIQNQRQARRRGELDAEKTALLEALPGWFWKYDADAAWRAAYDALCEFARAHKRFPKQAESAGGMRLGAWVCDQRTAWRTGRLAAERAALLEAVPGWFWKFDGDAAWCAAYDTLCEFVRAHDRFPRWNETVGDMRPRLDKWVEAQHSAWRRSRLAKKRAALLEALPGWRWIAGAAGAAGAEEAEALPGWRWTAETEETEEAEETEALPGWRWAEEAARSAAKRQRR